MKIMILYRSFKYQVKKYYLRRKTKHNFRKLAKWIDEKVFSIYKQNRQPLGLSNKYNWILEFPIGNYRIVYTYQTRGSIIEIYLGETRVACWVDQTRQYGSLMGLNDIKYSIEDINKIYEVWSTQNV